MVKQSLNRFLANFDLQVRRCSKDPSVNLLGLTKRPIRTVFDIGANEGQFASTFLPKFPEASFYCFEPLPSVFKRLEAWAATLNGRVTPINVALGDSEGTTAMHMHVDHPSSSSFLAATDLHRKYAPSSEKEDDVLVNVTTLDRAVSSLRQSPEILIKLDVQGFEDRVIRGGVKTFRQASVCIIECCLDVLYEGQATFLDLANALHALGYSYAGNLFQSCDVDGHVVFVDAVFLK